MLLVIMLCFMDEDKLPRSDLAQIFFFFASSTAASVFVFFLGGGRSLNQLLIRFLLVINALN